MFGDLKVSMFGVNQYIYGLGQKGFSVDIFFALNKSVSYLFVFSLERHLKFINKGNVHYLEA